ncbi:MAG: tRNA (adenosine(37)-N6)-threonylcarbamoyltransferase complex transferase subunit TsaD [Patescibacteria group bacterium]|nr:tRNA (adenosine(37)-N6)-threonylcarbamoyltransferase complex transferase subunit TsaD [Patescibacteria group bacterium]
MSRKNYKILAIESSCDETSASLCEAKLKVESGKLKIIEDIKILSNVVSSQVKLHAKYGGVYPELASREHVKNILPVIEQALLESNPKLKVQMSNQIQNSKLKTIHNTKYIIQNTIDAIAVTTGPGLIGSLLVGVETAKTLAYVLNKPIFPINHVEGHIYSNFVREISNSKFLISKQILRRSPHTPDSYGVIGQNPNDQKSKIIHNTRYIIQNTTPQFPLIALVVSGGHTSLIYMKNHLQYQVIGETLDDAAGEAFDKVAKLLGLSYPGGPAIAKMAMAISNSQFLISNQIPISKSQFPNQPPKLTTNFHFPRPMINEANFDFSFSGLKTSVLYAIKKLKQPINQLTKQLICYEFQNAVVETLVAKTIRAAKKYKVKSILLCGGVASNSRLREEFSHQLLAISSQPRFFVPEKSLCTDNAAMIGAAAAYKIALGVGDCTDWKKINANANLKL